MENFSKNILNLSIFHFCFVFLISQNLSNLKRSHHQIISAAIVYDIMQFGHRILFSDLKKLIVKYDLL